MQALLPCPYEPSPHHSLGNLLVAAGSSDVQGGPALIVSLVHIGTVLHQELHHLHVLINAGLRGGGKGERREPWGMVREAVTGPPDSPGECSSTPRAPYFPRLEVEPMRPGSQRPPPPALCCGRTQVLQVLLALLHESAGSEVSEQLPPTCATGKETQGMGVGGEGQAPMQPVPSQQLPSPPLHHHHSALPALAVKNNPSLECSRTFAFPITAGSKKVAMTVQIS